jgi:hypothetical protein
MNSWCLNMRCCYSGGACHGELGQEVVGGVSDVDPEKLGMCVWPGVCVWALLLCIWRFIWRILIHLEGGTEVVGRAVMTARGPFDCAQCATTDTSVRCGHVSPCHTLSTHTDRTSVV